MRSRELFLNSEKRRCFGYLLIFTPLLIVAVVLWLLLDRQRLLLWFACVLAVGIAVSLIRAAVFVGCLCITEQNGRRMTAQARLKLLKFLGFLGGIVVLLAGYYLYNNLPILEAAFGPGGRLPKFPDLAFKDMDFHFPTFWEGISLPKVKIGFWHIVVAVACIAVVAGTFYVRVRRGIIAIPVMAAYAFVLLRACSGNYPAFGLALVKVLGAALGILLISGLLLWDFRGFGVLMGLVRLLVPFTLLCMIAIILKDSAPISALPLNFRAILFWGFSFALFTAQTFQLLGAELPEFGQPEPDREPWKDMTGDEITGGLDIFD